MLKTIAVFDLMEEIAPMSLSEGWDNPGLQVGYIGGDTKGILVALDASTEAIAKMRQKGLNLLITHHPLFFSAIKSLNTDVGVGEIVREAIKNDITIFSAHTNLDSAQGGVNDILADAIGLKNAAPLVPSADDESVGLGRAGNLPVTITLGEATEKIKKALHTSPVRLLGDKDRIVQRIAVCGGSGGSLIDQAVKSGADLYVTGDIKYHDARLAEERGLALIDAGHFGTEQIVVEKLATRLRESLNRKGIHIPVSAYMEAREPFAVI